MLKLGLSTMKIIDALSFFRQNILSTIKQLQEKKQAELKQQIFSFYISLIKYLSEFYEFYEFTKFVRIEFFQVTFVELKIHHIDYFDKIFNEMDIQSTDEIFHQILLFIIKIEEIVKKKANTTKQSIIVLKSKIIQSRKIRCHT